MNPMMLVHFKETFPFRVAEWFMATVLILWGAVLLHPDFDANIFARTLFDWFSPATFGIGCLAVGLLRFAALGINGLWWRTPFIRLAMAFLSNFFWVQIVLGVVESDRVTTGLAVYPMFVVLEFYNSFRAAHDSRLSWTAVKGAVAHGRTG